MKDSFKGRTEAVYFIHPVEPFSGKKHCEFIFTYINVVSTLLPFAKALCHKALMGLLWVFTATSPTQPQEGGLAAGIAPSTTTPLPTLLSIFITVLLSPSKLTNVLMLTLGISQLTIINNLTHTEHVCGHSRVTGTKCQPCVKVHGPRHVSICEGSDGSTSHCIPGQKRDGGLWSLPVLASRPCSRAELREPLQQGRAIGTPAAGGEGRASGTWSPNSCGCLCSQGLHSDWTAISSFLCVNGQVKDYRALGTGLEYHGWEQESALAAWTKRRSSLICLTLNDIVAKALKEANWKEYL